MHPNFENKKNFPKKFLSASTTTKEKYAESIGEIRFQIR